MVVSFPTKMDSSDENCLFGYIIEVEADETEPMNHRVHCEYKLHREKERKTWVFLIF